MTTAARTTAALMGDLLASKPGIRLPTKEVAAQLERDRAGVNRALEWLHTAKAVTLEADPADRRRNVVFMTEEQAAAWLADNGQSIATRARFNLVVSPSAAAAAAGTRKEAERRRQPLRFAVWSDGAIAVEGLARTQLTLPAIDAYALSLLLSSLPEGALQALFDSPLKPSFSLRIDRRDHPLTPEQAADLVAYIEQLPAKALRAANDAAVRAAGQAGGHRVHRIETAADLVKEED